MCGRLYTALSHFGDREQSYEAAMRKVHIPAAARRASAMENRKLRPTVRYGCECGLFASFPADSNPAEFVLRVSILQHLARYQEKLIITPGEAATNPRSVNPPVADGRRQGIAGPCVCMPGAGNPKGRPREKAELYSAWRNMWPRAAGSRFARRRGAGRAEYANKQRKPSMSGI